MDKGRQFLGRSEALESGALSLGEKYNWIEEALIRFRYRRLERAEKRVIWQYVDRITGYSRSQVSRVITEYKRREGLERMLYQRHLFTRKHSPATAKIMDQEYESLC